MAWQTPKTDWGPADGVRDSDFNRIEENIRTLYEGTAPFEGVTLFVSPAGNDASGDGSYSNPFASITKAVLALPKDFNGAPVSINIAEGTYDESVVIRGFSGGVLNITGSAGTTVTFNSLTVDACAVRVSPINVALTASPGLVVSSGATFSVANSLDVTGGSTGLLAFDNSTVSFENGFGAHNVSTAISASNNAKVFVFYLLCDNVGTAMVASNGATISYGVFDGAVTTTLTATSYGGRIYTGSAPGSPGNAV